MNRPPAFVVRSIINNPPLGQGSSAKRNYAVKASWQKLGNAPREYLNHSSVRVGDKLFVLRGRGLLFSSPYVDSVDLNTWKWDSQKVEGKWPRANLKGHLFGKEIITVGTRIRNKGINSLDTGELPNLS